MPGPLAAPERVAKENSFTLPAPLLLLALLVITGSLSGRSQSSPLFERLDCFNVTLCGRPQRGGSKTTRPAIETIGEIFGAKSMPSLLGLKTKRLASRETKSDTKRTRGAQRLAASGPPDGCQTCAAANEFPWYARLELYFGNGPGVDEELHYCGATIVDRLFLLTSASCVKRPRLGLARRGLVTAGLQNLLEKGAGRWQVRSIATFCGRQFEPERIYSNFSDLWRPGEDVTVVKLNASLQLNERVAPVCLRDPDSLLDWNPDEVVMAGFGVYDQHEQLPPARLSKHLMRACNKSELALVAHRRRPDQICAIDAKRQGNPCEGDQGNGLYAQLPLIERVGLHSILGLPGERCEPGRAEPVLLSELTSLKVQIKEMLAGC